MTNNQLFAYFGHHKCGTTWMVEMLIDVCRKLMLKAAYVHNSESFVDDLLNKPDVGFLFHVNADVDHLKKLPAFRGFHMVRDPRDMVVSAYFSHRYTHELQHWLIEHRLELQKRDKNDGLLFEIKSRLNNLIMNHIRTWDYKQNNVIEVRMEEMTANSDKMMVLVFDFLGITNNSNSDINISVKELLEIVEKHNFKTKSGGREPGVVDTNSHYRSGKPGDWKNHFTDLHKQTFKESFQDVLEQLGYEKDDSW